jgi:hypothetical protein
MEPPHETGFPATFSRWVLEIVQTSPEAARLTLLELIVGAVLASALPRGARQSVGDGGWSAMVSADRLAL